MAALYDVHPGSNLGTMPRHAGVGIERTILGMVECAVQIWNYSFNTEYFTVLAISPYLWLVTFIHCHC